MIFENGCPDFSGAFAFYGHGSELFVKNMLIQKTASGASAKGWFFCAAAKVP